MRLLVLFLILVAAPLTLWGAENKNIHDSIPEVKRGAVQQIEPFGAGLFQGNFSKDYFDGFNEGYEILPGDRIRLQMWGAQSFDGVIEVDARGNLFLPEIGPVRVEGISHSELEGAVQNKIRSVFTDNVRAYVNLLRPQPVAVFVAGYVESPGRYSGGPTDSVMYFLDLAGGIDAEKGSYRDIRIIRDGKLLTSIDLYAFLRSGAIKRPRLEDGDVILVTERGSGIEVEGQVRHSARFEFDSAEPLSGKELIQLVMPESKASHVSVVGTRKGAPYNIYLSMQEFDSLMLKDGDRVRFHADIPGETIMVSAEGAIVGASRYPVHKATRLKTLLSQIAVEPQLANLEGVRIQRKSVARKQKKALNEALARLEQSALTATSSSVDEANIRVREAELIAEFVEKARKIEPDGTVVVSRNGNIADIYLENGDEVIIPAKSDVVMISGEVTMPQAVVWSNGYTLRDYVNGAGGFSDRADKDRLLLVKPNGQVMLADNTSVAAGDQILVLPRYDSKNMQVLKDVSQIIYQIAVATKVALDI